MSPPIERLTVPRCIGCGAMRVPGRCATGCLERRLDLVEAELCDRWTSVRAHAATRTAVLSVVADELAAADPGPGEWAAAYRGLQASARTALRSARAPSSAPDAMEAPIMTTWWCPRCGGIDAPQPCLGVCVWRPAEWVRADAYASERQAALDAQDVERRLRRPLGLLATVTPRAGGWEASLRALRAQIAEPLA